MFESNSASFSSDQDISQTVEKVAQTNSSVLIIGEAGTGKELIARTIHERSARARGEWVAVNCASLTSDALEADLFGTAHSTGKLAQAQSGTLFLEEVSEMALHIQQKLMRLLDSNALDIRVISSTSQNLEPLVTAKGFSQELYYKISVVPIKVPALRERRGEISKLVSNYIEKVNRITGGTVTADSTVVIDALSSYNWPGNLKELESVIERIVISKGAGDIELNDLPSRIFQGMGAGATFAGEVDVDFPRMFLPERGLDLKNVVTAFENHLVDQALARTSGNKNRASMLLGLNRTTLVEKLRKRGMITPLRSSVDGREDGGPVIE
jgi:DNA-binding NtrC family response regulator